MSLIKFIEELLLIITVRFITGVSSGSRGCLMSWFNNLSIRNKIALISLLLSALGIYVAVFEFKVGNKKNQAPIATSIEKPKSETLGKNSPIINNTKGDVVINYQSLGMSLEAHESILRDEIEKVENELKQLGDEKTKKLIEKLSRLRKELNKVIDEKTRLAKMVYEYRKKFSELNASRLSLHANKSDKEIKETDLSRIEESEKERAIVISEIEKNKDEKRMKRLLNILIKDTESMDDEERGYWHDIFGIMSFKQKLRLTEILAVERRKLADLERKYMREIKALNTKHLKELNDAQIRDLEKKGDKKAVLLMKIKSLTITKPSIDQLRVAELKTKELIKSNPNYLDAYIYLIEILNKYDEDRSYDSKIALESAKERFQNSGEFNKQLAYVYLKLDESKKAYPLLKKAVMLLNDDEELLRIFSGYAPEYDDTLLALSLLNDAYEKNKNKSRFITRYSYILNRSGNNKKSIDVLLKFIESDKTSSSVYEQLGWRYYTKKVYKLAGDYFTEASELSVKNYSAPFMAALTHVELNNDLSIVIDLLNKSLQRFDVYSNHDKHDEGEIHLSLAVIYLENSQPEKAIEYSSLGVKNTHGCSPYYMKERNWHNKMLAMLKQHRLSIGCP